MALYTGNISLLTDSEQEKRFLEFVKEKYLEFDTEKYERSGKIYFSQDEDVVIEFINTIEETFRDMWFNVFCVDEENNVAVTVSYRDRTEVVCSYDQIKTEDGKLQKLHQIIEEVTDECIRRRKEEKNAQGI